MAVPKRLGALALFAIMAAVCVLVGTSEKSSATVLCLVNSSPCPISQAYPVPSKLEASLSPGSVAEFREGNFVVKCPESIMKVTTTKDLGPNKVLDAEVTGWTFEIEKACTGKCTKVTALKLPYKEASQEFEGIGFGEFSISAGEGQKVVFKLEGCPLGTSCTYDIAAIGFNFLGGEPPEWERRPMTIMSKTGGGGQCPLTLEFEASYWLAVTKMWAEPE
jgi:hypothetical protein